MKKIKFLESKIPLNNFIVGVIGALAGIYFFFSLQIGISSWDVWIRTILFFGPIILGIVISSFSEAIPRRYPEKTLLYYFLGFLGFLVVLLIEVIVVIFIVAYLGIELAIKLAIDFPKILILILSTGFVYALFLLSLSYWDRTQAKKDFAKRTIKRLSEENFIQTELK